MGLAGCHSMHLASLTYDKPDKEGPAVAAPSQRPPFRVSQFLFYADFDVDRRLPLFTELANLREQVHKELQLPSANTVIHVYLFKDRERYEQFMKSNYPKLPRRRAFFVAQPRAVGATEDLLVYTFWGERIQEDLRHELTHALLHSVLRDVPLWLDEGLAEYFEVPPGWKGVNFQHLDELRRDNGALFNPDLARLEKLRKVEEMASQEYCESWAWVHFMLHSRPENKKILVGYLQDLRTTNTPSPLRPRLAASAPDLDALLDKHLAGLDGAARPLVTTQR
jgi:hypothetical protein